MIVLPHDGEIELVQILRGPIGCVNLDHDIGMLPLEAGHARRQQVDRDQGDRDDAQASDMSLECALA